jgi:hypothetical protein
MPVTYGTYCLDPDCSLYGEFHGHEDGDGDAVAAPPHADYPHNPGTLYDCPQCEAMCFCTELYGEQRDASTFDVCIHCALTLESEGTSHNV